ncbi:MAG: asparaginase [Burkholderiales bacterium]|nr:asparaginase [Burkholderiales bacterium]
MKKILILYTGGTVGMDYTDSGLNVIPGLFYSQIKLLAPIAGVELELIEYKDLIDSSDINLDHWCKIIQDILVHYDDYDGFVVVHGTDTMAYTASLLSFALRGLNKPVILTGAQLPLVHRRSDGWNNLIDAVYSAMQEELNEVTIAFNHKLFRGCRTQKISTNRFVGFDSVDEEPLAEFGINISWYKKRWLKTNKFSFTPIMPKSVNILNLILTPGYTTDFISEVLVNKPEIDGVVLQTYGSGTIPMKNHKFTDAIKMATDRGTIIVSVTQVIEGRISNDYSNSKLSQLGVLNGYDMTPEAALAKLWILLSSNMSKSNIRATIGTSIVGELTDTY